MATTMLEVTKFARLVNHANEEKRIAEEDRRYKEQLKRQLEERAIERQEKRFKQFFCNMIYGIGGLIAVGAISCLVAILAAVF